MNMVINKDLEFSTGLMEVRIEENLNKIILKVKEFIVGLMVDNFQENGKIIECKIYLFYSL